MSEGIIASVRVMRPWLRFVATVLLLAALWLVYLAVMAILGRSSLPRSAGFCMAILALLALVPTLFLWRQAEATTRFIAEPSAQRLIALTSAIRRFWRLAGIVLVLQVTVFVVGFALHGGW